MPAQSKKFGEKLRRAIEKRGLTQRQVVSMLGISPSGLSHFINGRVPDGLLVKKIADTLNVSLDWLLANEDKTSTTYEPRKHPSLPEEYIAQHGYSEEEKKYIEKLLEIFRTKDPRLANLVEKIEHVFKEGGRSEKAWVRGVIEQAYDEVVAAKSSGQKIKKGAA